MADSLISLLLGGFLLIVIGVIILAQGGNPSGSDNIVPLFGLFLLLGGIACVATAIVSTVRR
jgi:drug/metabolite transporter (DMT)-like permease